MSTCILTVREIKSPIMGTFRGYRILVAIPNSAGHKATTSEPAPSFDKTFLIATFGDYIDHAAVLERMPAIGKTLRRLGFDSITVV